MARAGQLPPLCRAVRAALAVYTDQHTTYKSPAKPTLDEQLAGQAPQSQFERSLAELGVEVMHAHSPQAKGRLERLFGTFQDRLIKELRLAGVRTVDAANHLLDGYLPRYNQRFTVPTAQAGDLHRPCPARRDLARSLCLKTVRVLRRDWTVAYNGQLYQIQTHVRTTRVLIEEPLEGTLRITHQGQPLAYHLIAARPSAPRSRPRSPDATDRSNRRGIIPGKNGCCLPDKHRRRRRSINRTFLLWEEADISKLG